VDKYNCQINLCGTPVNTLKRIAGLMMNSRKFTFHGK
jgi:hypothetical protein